MPNNRLDTRLSEVPFVEDMIPRAVIEKRTNQNLVKSILSPELGLVNPHLFNVDVHQDMDAGRTKSTGLFLTAAPACRGLSRSGNGRILMQAAPFRHGWHTPMLPNKIGTESHIPITST